MNIRHLSINVDGNLYTFGDNEYGQLGRYGNRAIPGKVPISIPIIQASCGGTYTACIDANNNIWVFGNNGSRQLGLGGTRLRTKSQIGYPMKIPNHKAKIISCGQLHTAFIDPKDHIWTFGNNEYLQLGLLRNKSPFHPTEITQVYNQGRIIKRDFRVKQVHCGEYITVFIDLEKNLWVAGRDKTLNIKSK